MSVLGGGCACGAVRYELEGPPLFVHCCHCRTCQREIGSAFALNVLIEASRVRLISGELMAHDMPTESGRAHDIFRCRACQTAVWSDYGRRGYLLFVRAGTLDTPDAVSPDVHIYTRSKLSFVQLDPKVPAFDAYYDMRTLWPEESLRRRQSASDAAKTQNTG